MYQFVRGRRRQHAAEFRPGNAFTFWNTIFSLFCDDDPMGKSQSSIPNDIERRGRCVPKSTQMRLFARPAFQVRTNDDANGVGLKRLPGDLIAGFFNESDVIQPIANRTCYARSTLQDGFANRAEQFLNIDWLL